MLGDLTPEQSESTDASELVGDMEVERFTGEHVVILGDIRGLWKVGEQAPRFFGLVYDIPLVFAGNAKTLWLSTNVVF